MRRLIALTLIALFAILTSFSGIAAQQAVNYWVRSISSQITADQVAVEFTVINNGAAVAVAQTAHLFDDSGKVLASQPVKPLGTNQSIQMILTVSLSQFAPDSSPTIYATVGIDQLPPEGQRTSANIASLPVYIPATIAATPIPPESTGNLPLNLNLQDHGNLALILVVIVVVVVLLWVLTVIGRLLFSRPPTMAAWQPPYIITPLVDPNSTNGRRQLWQQHAESDTLPAPCAPGDYKVRKLLIGSSGAKLAGWRVTGLRVSQYDRYGRVARSQTVLPKKVAKSLDRAVRKSQSLDWNRALRAVRPAARSLTAAVMKKSNQQNAILPVALDLRFVGMHGEVRILFELYGCAAGAWQEIDHWEPEMRVVNGSIHENFTYTLLGQHPEEGRKQFQKRLEGDFTHLLAIMVQAPPPPPPALDTAETKAVAE